MSDAIYTLALASKRGVSLFHNLDREGRKKVDKPGRIELPSSYTPPPKKSFFEKYPPPCVSHIQTYYKRANNRA